MKTMHMNTQPIRITLIAFIVLFSCINGFTQSVACDGSFLNAGLDDRLCFNPNGGSIDLNGSSSPNVFGYVWSDQNGEIARDNLTVEDYFVSETTTVTLSGIVISDNQVADGDFGTGDDFSMGFPPNYQGSFFTVYQMGPVTFPPVSYTHLTLPTILLV